MVSQIIVPLDSSTRAEAILPHACALARATGSTITLLRVITPVEASQNMLWLTTAPAALRDQWEANTLLRIKTYLAAVAERLRADDVPLHTRILRSDDVAAAIVRYAHEQSALTCIAMATHARSGVEQFFLGSVAHAVLGTATAPLFLVRTVDACAPGLDQITYRTIAVPLDSSAFAAQALPHAQALATTLGAAVVLVAAVPPVDDTGLDEARLEPYWTLAEAQAEVQGVTQSLQRVADQLHAEGVTVRVKVVADTPAQAILNACAEEHADLLVMATHGRGGLGRVLLGSVATDVLQHTTVPILLIRPQLPPDSENS